MPDAEFDALVQSVSVIGFMFGFMRPAVLRQDRKASTRTASAIANLLVRSLSPEDPVHRPASASGAFTQLAVFPPDCPPDSFDRSVASNIFLDGFLAHMILRFSSM